MIDVENTVFNTVATALRATYSGVFVAGEYVPAPPSFPAVMLVQTGNTTASQDLSGATTHDSITLQVDVYSNLASGKKKQAKDIASDIDDIIVGKFRFRRMMMEPIQNLNDATIYRITARYTRYMGESETL